MWYFFIYNYFNITESTELSLKYLKEAATLGHTPSQIEYGLFNCGIEDEEEAIKWFKLAAESGDSTAQIYLAEKLQEKGQEKSAFEWFLRSAESGNIDAFYPLANCYKEGVGVHSDSDKAFYWFSLAEHNGDTKAVSHLCRMFETGQGVALDEEKATQMAMTAAMTGDSLSQYNLAIRYYYGNGVEQNLEKSYYWFNLSAEQSFSHAQRRVACMYASGEGVEQDLVKALLWLHEAYEEEDTLTMLLIAIFDRCGISVFDVNVEASRELLKGYGTRFDERFLNNIPSACFCNGCNEEDFKGFNYECENLSCGSDLCKTCYENGVQCHKCGGSKFVKHHSLQCFIPILKLLNEQPKHVQLDNLIKLLE